MLVRPATTQAATAATSSAKKSRLLSWANSGASRTPARLASRLDRTHDPSATRSASTPWSCTSRGLSTTARMRRPAAVRENSSASPATTTPVATSVAIWAASST
jgi:hypothetical protein